MDVSEWTAVDESAKQMLLRVMRGKLPVLKSFSPLYQVSLHAGDVLEVAGPSGSAKSEFLLQVKLLAGQRDVVTCLLSSWWCWCSLFHCKVQMAVECILPKEHDGVVYGGCGAAVVWFDLDCRFDRLRFLEVVRSRLRASGKQVWSLKSSCEFAALSATKNPCWCMPNGTWQYQMLKGWKQMLWRARRICIRRA